MIETKFPYRLEGFALKKALITTFDFDYEVAESLVGKESPDKFLFIRGDGLFKEKENSEINSRVYKIFYPLIDDKIAKKYFHPKLLLALYENEVGDYRFLLRVGSKNLYPFNNLECGVSFLGKVGTSNKNNEVLQGFLKEIASILNTNPEVRLFLDELIGKLNHIGFSICGDSYLDSLIESSQVEFIGPSCAKIGIVEADYEEVVVISPNVSDSLLSSLANKSKVTLVTQPLMVASLIKKGVTNVNYIIPKSERYIHAKVFLCKKSNGEFDLYAGSMNLTEYAYYKNDEFMIKAKGLKNIDSIPSFLMNFLEGEYEEENMEDRPILPEALLDATRIEKRIKYLNRLIGRKHYGDEELSHLTRFLLSSSCNRLLFDYYLHGLPPFIYKEKKDKDKVRPLFLLEEEGMVLFGLINYCLHRYDDLFSKSVYLHVYNRNFSNLFSSIRGLDGLKDYYLFRSDIHAFDPSISEELLVSSLESFYSFDPLLCDFLISIAKKKDYRKMGSDEIHNDAPAQKTGFPLAGLFENVVLSDFDKKMEKESSVYYRFGDDILVGSKDIEETKRLKQLVATLLNERKLSLSEKKSYIVNPGETFEFLGMEIERGEIDIPKKSVDSLMKDLSTIKKKMLVLFKKRHIPTFLRVKPTLNFIEKKLKEYPLTKLFSVITTPKSLHKIDECIVDTIRVVVTGKEGNSKYRLSYKDLQKYGYTSLVNRYFDFISG